MVVLVGKVALLNHWCGICCVLVWNELMIDEWCRTLAGWPEATVAIATAIYERLLYKYSPMPWTPCVQKRQSSKGNSCLWADNYEVLEETKYHSELNCYSLVLLDMFLICVQFGYDWTWVVIWYVRDRVRVVLYIPKAHKYEGGGVAAVVHGCRCNCCLWGGAPVVMHRGCRHIAEPR